MDAALTIKRLFEAVPIQDQRKITGITLATIKPIMMHKRDRLYWAGQAISVLGYRIILSKPIYLTATALRDLSTCNGLRIIILDSNLTADDVKGAPTL